MRLWREKRGEEASLDLSGVLIAQLGLVTEDLNRRWYELNSGNRVSDVQRHVAHRTIPWMMTNPQREIEQRANAVLERTIVFDLAADVANDAAETGLQELEFSPGALELVGKRIAPHHDGGAPGQAQIALAQFDALALGRIDQLLDRAVDEPRVRWMAIAFSCTVVSTTTRSRSLVSIAPLRCATERLSCNSAAICSSPSRWLQRVSDERSNGAACWNTTSPQKYWKYGFSTHLSHTPPRQTDCACV